MKARLSPITQLAISGSQLFRRLCGDQTNDNVGPMAMIQFRREHDGRSHLRDFAITPRAPQP